MGHALHQVLGVGRQCRADHFRVGEGKIRRRRCGEHLVQVEERPLTRLLVDALGIAGEVLGPARGDEIGLLPEIEELAVGPIGILETVVAGLGHRDGLDLFAEKAAEGAAPKVRVALEQFVLRRDELARLARPMPGDLAKRLRCLAHFRGEAVRALPVGTLGERRKCFGPLVEQTHHILGKRVELIDVKLLWLGFFETLVSLLHQFVLVLPPISPAEATSRGESRFPGAYRANAHCAMQYSK